MHLAIIVSTYLATEKYNSNSGDENGKSTLTGSGCPRCQRAYRPPVRIAGSLRRSQGGSTPGIQQVATGFDDDQQQNLACNESSLLADLSRVDIILRNHLGRVLIPHLNDLCNDLTSMVWMESEISAQNSSTTKSSFLSANWVCWTFNCSS